MKRKEYYKAELFRAIFYPLIFALLAFLLIHFGMSRDIFDPDDLRIYFGVAIIGLGASLLLYFVTYRHKWFRKR